MDLEAAFKQNASTKFHCRITVIADSLDEKNSQAFQAAINNDNLSPYSITRAVRSEGITLSENAIYKHRRGECICAKR